MALIDRTRNALHRLLQKYNRGLPTPDEENSANEYVQNKLVREAFDYMDTVKNMQKVGRGGKIDYDRLNLAKEKVRKLKGSEDITYDSVLERFNFPSDYMFMDEMFYNGGDYTTAIEEIGADERIILRSPEIMPSELYPVYMEHGTDVEIIPDSIVSDVKMYYYKNPTPPKWTYVEISNKAVFNQGASDFVDFILPDICFDEIVVELAQYWSIQIKQPDVVQVFDRQDTKTEQLKRE